MGLACVCACPRPCRLQKKSEARFFNIFMWMMLSVGMGLLLVLYSREWYARFGGYQFSELEVRVLCTPLATAAVVRHRAENVCDRHDCVRRACVYFFAVPQVGLRALRAATVVAGRILRDQACTLDAWALDVPRWASCCVAMSEVEPPRPVVAR